MSNKLRLNRDEFTDIIDESEPVAKGSWRWGHLSTYVFERDGKHWMFSVQVHCQDGIQDRYVDAVEVRPVTKTVTDWEVVK